MADAKYAPWVTLLRDDSAYLRSAPAPAYWALSPHYVGQITECACSLASATMLVNAARRTAARSAGERLVTQPMLLDAVGSPTWRDGVGHDGGHGVTLRQLAELLQTGLGKFGIAGTEIDAVPLADGDGLARYRQALAEGEANAGRYIVVNYHMATAIGAGDYGHFSPLGAYDAARDRVLVLDVYRVEFEPYWLPTEQLFAAMATVNRIDGEPRGYLRVRLPVD